MTRRATGVLAGAAACVVIMSGCSLAGPAPLPYVDVRPSIPPAGPASAECPRDGVGLGADGADPGPVPVPGTLPSAFRPELVRYCRLGDSGPAVGGLRYTVAEETSAVDDRLLGSLTLPDQELDPRDHAACAAMYTPPTYLLLVDAQKHAYRPHLPAAPCSRPRPEVQAAIDGLRPIKVTTYTFTKAE